MTMSRYAACSWYIDILSESGANKSGRCNILCALITPAQVKEFAQILRITYARLSAFGVVMEA
jgi:hypothetical protein